LTVIVLALGAAGLYLMTAQKVYEGRAVITIEQTGTKVLQEMLISQGQTQNFLQTQADLIQSTAILAEAAAREELRSLPGLANSPNIVAELRGRVKATIALRSDIITVSAQSPDAKEAAAIANNVVEAYRAYTDKKKKTSTGDALRILGDQLAEVEREIKTKTDEKIRYVTDSKISAGSNRSSADVDRYSALVSALTQTELLMWQAQSAFQQAEPALKDADLARVILDSPNARAATSRLREDLQERRRQLLTVKSSYGPEFPQLASISALLKSLEDDLQREESGLIRAYVGQLKNEFETLKGRRDEVQKKINELQASVQRYNEAVVRMEALESDLRRLEGRSALLQDQIRMLGMTREQDIAQNISVLEPAQPVYIPVQPKVGLTLAAALFGGLLVGSGLALLRDVLDHRLRSAEEVKELLGVPVLGVVPHIQSARTPAERGQIVHREPMCDVAEAYRTVRTAVYFGVPGGVKTLLVTSPQPGDGKTTLASNLAIAMAQAGNRVMLLDCDFRKPMQHKVFELDKSIGASSVLAGEAPLDDAIRSSAVEGLDILPCGPLPANPSEILNSKTFADLVEQLSQRYDTVVIDSPPVLPVTDARILAAFCDVTILALRAEKSTRKGALYARDVLLSVGGKLLGTIVNDVPRRRGRYGYYYGKDSVYAYGYGNATRRAGGSSRGDARSPQVRGELVAGPNGNANGGH
jgi:capsular exopolysaccharide synthesis family protein